MTHMDCHALALKQEFSRQLFDKVGSCIPSLNELLDVPTNEDASRPWSTGSYSKSKALLLLLNIVYAGYCLSPVSRVSLIVSIIVTYAVCEHVYRNYPWKEPLRSKVLHYACCYMMVRVILVSTLLLVLGGIVLTCWEDIKIYGPSLLAAILLLSFPIIRQFFSPPKKAEDDYDQLLRERPIPANFSVIEEILWVFFCTSERVYINYFLLAAIFVVSIFISDAGLVFIGVLFLAVAILVTFLILFYEWDSQKVKREQLIMWLHAYSNLRSSELRLIIKSLKETGKPGNESDHYYSVRIPLLLDEQLQLLKGPHATKIWKLEAEKDILPSTELKKYMTTLRSRKLPTSVECCIS